MAKQIKTNQQVIDLADRLGISLSVADDNWAELNNPIDLYDITEEEFKTIPDPVQNSQMWSAEDVEKKGLFERMFGYNPSWDLPANYQKMSSFQRAVLKAQLASQNISTRMGLAAQHGLTPLAKSASSVAKIALTPRVSGEQFDEFTGTLADYMVSDKEARKNRLEEDQYYEKRIRKELQDKKASGVELTLEEEDQLAYLNETVPSGIQLLPEFSAKTVAFIEETALYGEIAKMIPMPGGNTLHSYLSKAGQATLGKWVLRMAMKYSSSNVATAALDGLAKQIVKFGPNAFELFSWGVVHAEDDESKILAGTKMLAWAVLPLALIPGAKVIGSTRAGTATKEFISRVVAKTVSPIADKFSKMSKERAIRKFINAGLTEADDLFYKENNRVMTLAEKKVVKETLEEVVTKTSEIASKSADDINAFVEQFSAVAMYDDLIGRESVIPKILRNPETVSDDIINSSIAYVERATGFTAVKQPNGSYAVLNTDNMHEVAVNIKRKELSKKLTEVIFGDTSKAPEPNKFLIPKKVRTPRTVNEETQLKRVINMMERASNDGYRAGVKSATEKAAIKIEAAKDRISTLRQENLKGWQNAEFARQLVKDFIPKEEQHLFLARIIKSRTEGGLNSILDDIDKYLSRKRMNLSIDILRGTLKDAKTKYSTRAGEFAAAPDEIRPVLDSVSRISDNLTKLSQMAPDDAASLAKTADDAIGQMNSILSGKGKILDLPEDLLKDISGLGGNLNSDQIDAVSKLAQIILHRATDMQNIRLGNTVIKTKAALEQAKTLIIPKPVIPKKTKTLMSLVRDMYGVDSDHPKTLLVKMFGDNSLPVQLLDDLYEGEIKAYGVLRETSLALQDYFKKNNLDGEKILKGLNKKMTVKFGGKPYDITRNDALGLVMSMRDPYVFDDLYKGDAFSIGGYTQIPRPTMDELAEVVSKLTDDEMKFGSSFFHIRDFVSVPVNETSLTINGIKIHTDMLYYPKHVAMDIPVSGKTLSHTTAESRSYFMPRISPGGRIQINPFTREMMDFIQASSMYHGTAVPMRSLKTIFSDKELQAQLRSAGYEKELSNFLEILKRSEGMYTDSSVIDLLGNRLLNNFAKSVLGGRISSLGTQVASVPAAKVHIPSKYFAWYDSDILGKESDELMNVSDFFWYRWTGRRMSIEVGDIASTSSIEHFVFGKTPISEKPLSGLTWGDKQAIAKINKAAKRYLAAEKGLSGDELIFAASKLTEKATREGQPNWSILTRSKLASDTSVFKRSMTMFRTAQEAQLNIIKRAESVYQRSPKSLSDKKQLAEAYNAVGQSAAAVALWRSTWKYGRNSAVAGIAGWLGYATVSENDDVSEDILRQTAKTGSGLFPFGELAANLAEIGFDRVIGEGGYVNTTRDPISTVLEASGEVVLITSKWVKKWAEVTNQPEGYDINLVPQTINQLIDDIAEKQQDKEKAKFELQNEIAKDITNVLRATSMFTGLPIGPLDEWVAPGLKISPYSQVHKINSNNSSDPASLQRDVHKFYKAYNALEKKAKENGISGDELNFSIKMKLQKQMIEALIDTDKVLDGRQKNILDPLDKQLKTLFDENKKLFEELQ